MGGGGYLPKYARSREEFMLLQKPLVPTPRSAFNRLWAWFLVRGLLISMRAFTVQRLAGRFLQDGLQLCGRSNIPRIYA